MSYAHAYFAFYHHVGLFDQWKLSVSSRALKSNSKGAFEKNGFIFVVRASIKDFFLPGSTISIPNVGKWCFSQFKFRFACVVSPFRVSEQVGSVTVRSSLLLRFRLFLCLFVLQSPFSVFRYLYKQIVWHWKHDISQGKPVVSPRFACTEVDSLTWSIEVVLAILSLYKLQYSINI